MLKVDGWICPECGDRVHLQKHDCWRSGTRNMTRDAADYVLVRMRKDVVEELRDEVILAIDEWEDASNSCMKTMAVMDLADRVMARISRGT